MLIEDAFPELYAAMVEDPALYNSVEAYCVADAEDERLLESISSISKMSWWDTSLPSLHRVLRELEM